MLSYITIRTDKPINKGISLFLVPRNTSGITIIPQPKIATNSFASCEITLDSVALSNDMIIGGQDAGWGVITFAGCTNELQKNIIARHLRKDHAPKIKEKAA